MKKFLIKTIPTVEKIHAGPFKLPHVWLINNITTKNARNDLKQSRGKLQILSKIVIAISSNLRIEIVTLYAEGISTSPIPSLYY